MIMIESELRPMASKRMTNEELELARYAARELQVRPLVLVRDLIRARARTNGERSHAISTGDRMIAGAAAEA